MAVNYEITRYSRDWEVVEKKTNQTICLTTTRRKAYAVTAFLNKGGAFNGNTPAFFNKGKRIKF